MDFDRQKEEVKKTMMEIQRQMNELLQKSEPLGLLRQKIAEAGLELNISFVASAEPPMDHSEEATRLLEALRAAINIAVSMDVGVSSACDTILKAGYNSAAEVEIKIWKEKKTVIPLVKDGEVVPGTLTNKDKKMLKNFHIKVD